jgi:hypothetical protein
VRNKLPHKLKFSLAVFTAIVLSLTCLAGTAFAQSSPTPTQSSPAINGKVVDSTAGGGQVNGLEVTLTTYVNSSSTGVQKTTTDDQGNFSFTGLSTDATTEYVASVSYKNVQYTSDQVQLAAATPTQSIQLNVYETTNSDQSIQVTTGHMVVVPSSQGLLSVLEAWGINNNADRSYIGPSQGNPNTLHFTLPPGATNFAGDDGFSVDSTGKTAIYALPLIPGPNTVSYTYTVPFQINQQVSISHPADYAIPSFGIILPQTGITASSKTLAQSAPQNLQGTMYLYFTASNVQVGQNLDVSLTASQDAITAAVAGQTGTATTSSRLPWILILGGILALAVIILAMLLIAPRRRKAREVSKISESALPDVGTEADRLLEQIVQLDKEFEAGKIAEAEYREHRAGMKAKLASIIH